MLSQNDYNTDMGRDASVDIVEAGRAIAQAQTKDEARAIPYRPEYTYITGRVTASILLQQIRYWWFCHDRRPFYKFRGPCEHDLYKAEDSWTEELVFSPAEFDTALKTIGTKITKGVSKTETLKAYKVESLVIYWTDSNRVTWYQLNEPLFFALLHLAYNRPELLGKSGKCNYLDNPTLVNYLDSCGLRNYLYPENTPENTSENTIQTAATAAATEPPVSEPPPVKEKATRKRTGKGAAKKPRTYTAMQLAVCRVCKLDSEVLSNSMFGRVRAAGNALEGKYTPEQVYQVFGDGAIWWRVWPGNENRPPRPEEVRDKINDLLTRPANGNGHKGANGDGRRRLPTLAEFERESRYEQLLEQGVKPDVARRQAGLA